MTIIGYKWGVNVWKSSGESWQDIIAFANFFLAYTCADDNFNIRRL